MQRLFMLVLNPIYERFTSYVDEKTRMKIVAAALFSIVAFFYMSYCSPKVFNITYDYSTKGFIGIVFVAIAVLFSVDRPLNKVKWNRLLYICWIVCGCMMLFWETVYDMGYGFIPFIFSMILLFPCMYFVWNNRGDYEVLFSILSKSLIVAMTMFFVVCVIFFPMTTESLAPFGGRYNGAVGNPNNLGMMSAATVTAALYLISKRDKWIYFYMIICAVSVSLCFFAASRTSMIAICIQLLVFVLFIFNKSFSQKEKRVMLKNTIVLFVLIGILIPVNKVILEADPLSGILSSQYVYAEEKKGTETIKEESSPVIGQRFNTDNIDINRFSSGRIDVWKVYVDNINFRGHDVKENNLTDPLTGSKYTWAHNVFLELSYRAGIITGIVYCIIVSYVAIYVFKMLVLKRKYPDYLMFTMLATASFCIISMLEMAIFPLERDFILLYYVGIAPLFLAKRNVTENM